jgi:hypothetical protein
VQPSEYLMHAEKRRQMISNYAKKGEKYDGDELE